MVYRTRYCCLVAVGLRVPVSHCFAFYQELSTPSLSHPCNASADIKYRYKELIAFMKDELVFLEGHVFNEHSSQRFGGTSANTAKFLSQLQNVKLLGAQLYVQFRNFGEQKTAFSMDESSAKGYVRVIVNSGREDFRLNDFQAYLPKPKLPD